MRWLAAFALVLVFPASAQVAPILDEVSEEDQAFFRGCRAAIFYHLDPRAERRTIPADVAEMMRGQVTFIMNETLSEPIGSLEEGEEVLNFTENFFLSFSKSLLENEQLADDVVAREQRLIACQPVIWMVMGEHIDRLLALRESLQRR